MHETMPVQEPDYERMTADLIVEFKNHQLELGGQSVTFEQFVAIGKAVCDFANNSTPKEQAEYLADRLAKSGAELDQQKYGVIMPPNPPQESSEKNLNEPATEKAKKQTEKATDESETPAVKTVTSEKVSAERLSKATLDQEKDTGLKIVTLLPKSVIEQTVKLEITDIKKIRLAEDSIPVQESTISVPVEQMNTAELNSRLKLSEGAIESVERPPVVREPIELAPITLAENDDILQEHHMGLYEPSQEPVSELDLSEESFIEFNDETIVSLNLEQEELTQIIDPTDLATTEIVLPALSSIETEPDAEHSYEVESVHPITVTTEFIAQVLPTSLELVTEKLQTMQPEAATELASRIEMIVVVADRLHDLAVAEVTEGEEAKQIIAFLRREYEQVLVAVGIEPTDEILEEFIAHILSASYELQVPSAANYIEIADEGTHEKKLFDEQSVFAKAQNASSKLSQKLGNSIGHILLTNLAS